MLWFAIKGAKSLQRVKPPVCDEDAIYDTSGSFAAAVAASTSAKAAAAAAAKAADSSD